jgi:hypothetical protein
MTSRLRIVGDEALRALAGMKPEEALRRFKSAFKYGMKLPRANGKGASLPTYATPDASTTAPSRVIQFAVKYVF